MLLCQVPAPAFSKRKGAVANVVEHTELKLNSSMTAITSLTLPSTYSAFSRRNSSLLEGLLRLNSSSDDETDFAPMPDKKTYNKFYFRCLLQKYRIINEQHYQEVLANSVEF